MRRRGHPWPVAGLVLVVGALSGCPDPGPAPPGPSAGPTDGPTASPTGVPTTVPGPTATPGGESPARPAAGGDVAADGSSGPGGEPPVPVDGALFGGDAGVLPSPSADVERLLQPPAVAAVRSAGSCSGLAEPGSGRAVECDTVTTSTGAVLAWVVESPEDPPGVRAGFWRERPDGEWVQVLTTGDDPLEDHTGGTAATVVLPDGSEQVLLVLWRSGTGRWADAAVVGGRRRGADRRAGRGRGAVGRRRVGDDRPGGLRHVLTGSRTAGPAAPPWSGPGDGGTAGDRRCPRREAYWPRGAISPIGPQPVRSGLSM